MRIRPACWQEDLDRLNGLDISFVTERIYRVVRDDLSFRLVETAVDPPLHKAYGPLAAEAESLKAMPHAVVAELVVAERVVPELSSVGGGEGSPVGFLAAEYERWNRRVRIGHLYVASAHRRRGVGRLLVESAAGYARSVGARCLWIETQNVNHPAIRFYRQVGFRFCGLDDSLYDPQGPGRGETAVYLVRES